MLGSFHDGELDSEVRGRVEAHLEGCGACRERLEALGSLDGALQQGGMPLPEDLASSILACAAQAPPPLRPAPSLIQPRRILGAGLLAVGLFGATFVAFEKGYEYWSWRESISTYVSPASQRAVRPGRLVGLAKRATMAARCGRLRKGREWEARLYEEAAPDPEQLAAYRASPAEFPAARFGERPYHSRETAEDLERYQAAWDEARGLLETADPATRNQARARYFLDGLDLWVTLTNLDRAGDLPGARNRAMRVLQEIESEARAPGESVVPTTNPLVAHEALLEELKAVIDDDWLEEDAHVQVAQGVLEAVARRSHMEALVSVRRNPGAVDHLLWEVRSWRPVSRGTRIVELLAKVPTLHPESRRRLEEAWIEALGDVETYSYDQYLTAHLGEAWRSLRPGSEVSLDEELTLIRATLLGVEGLAEHGAGWARNEHYWVLRPNDVVDLYLDALEARAASLADGEWQVVARVAEATRVIGEASWPPDAQTLRYSRAGWLPFPSARPPAIARLEALRLRRPPPAADRALAAAVQAWAAPFPEVDESEPLPERVR
jgi:hypothetical protein